LDRDYSVRPYRRGDEEEIVDLLQSAFDGWPNFDLGCSPLEHWRWKYQDNVLKSVITLGVSGNRVIGARHSYFARIKIGGESFFSKYSADAAVHPEFRGMGVLYKMRDLSNELSVRAGARYIYYVSSNPILIRSWMRRRPPFPHRLLNLVRIRDVDEQLKVMPVKNAWLMRLGFYTLKSLNNFRNIFSGSRPSRPGLNIDVAGNFDSRIDEFWERVSDHHEFIVERSRDYLNWRYCDSRGGGFIVKQAEEDGRIVGFIVLRVNRIQFEYPVGFIVDLLTLPGRVDVADSLVGDAVEHFDSQNINLINYLVVKSHPYEKMMKRHGFLDSRVKPHLFYRSYGEEDEIGKIRTAPADKVHFAYGDIDSLPVEMPAG